MILSYTLRLVCLCFASFFAVHTALAVTVWAAAARAMQTGESMRPRSGERLLLTLRLMPVTFALIVVGALCIPSYLWLETNDSTERVGFACCATAVLGALICGDSLIRSVRGIFLSWRESMRCERAAATKINGSSLPLTIVESNAPVLALAGLIRTRVIISRAVLESLSAEELEAAIEHERAHHGSHDNWKRLALTFAPEILPLWRAFAPLNRCWARLIEWAADDDATHGNLGKSLSLAAALVRVAQMRGAFAASPLISFFLGHDRELSARIDRLIRPADVYERFPRRWRVALTIGTATLGVLAIFAMAHPATLSSVHIILEQFIR